MIKYIKTLQKRFWFVISGTIIITFAAFAGHSDEVNKESWQWWKNN